MTQADRLLSLFGDAGHASVDRAIAEFRSGRPVVISGGKTRVLALCVEAIDADTATDLHAFSQGQGRLLLPAARLRRLGAERRNTGGNIAVPVVDAVRIGTLCLGLEARLDAPVAPLSDIDTAALELASLSLTLPGVFLAPVTGKMPAGVVSVSAGDVHEFRRNAATNLALISRAPVPLEQSARTEFVVFRGGEGMRDQVAIIVGTPDLAKPVAVRMHSACLTGDLFGSLKCDCGDQLRSTVKQMAESDGGILLYLDQEGRGNGMANKMRA